MTEMLDVIVSKLQSKYGIKPEIDYDYYPVNSDSIIELIDVHLREEDNPPVSSGDCWVVRFASDLEVILLKRGVGLTFRDFYDTLSETKIEEGD